MAGVWLDTGRPAHHGDGESSVAAARIPSASRYICWLVGHWPRFGLRCR